jgi:hypothetical protein
MEEKDKQPEQLSASANQEMDEMDRLLALEEEKNAKYRKRILYLIPFNGFAMWGTIKYFQNV